MRSSIRGREGQRNGACLAAPEKFLDRVCSVNQNTLKGLESFSCSITMYGLFRIEYWCYSGSESLSFSLNGLQVIKRNTDFPVLNCYQRSWELWKMQSLILWPRYQNIFCTEHSGDSDSVRIKYAQITLRGIPWCPWLTATDPQKGRFTDLRKT